jgi:acetyl-CoA acetyltransferase
MADRTAVIVGIGQGEWPVAPELDGVQQHSLAAQRAVRDAGIAWSDLDGYMGAGGGGGSMVDDAVTMAEYLRIRHTYLDGTMVGGSSFEFFLSRGKAAIEAGLCDTILCTYGSNQLSRMGRTLGSKAFFAPGARVDGPGRWEAPYGNVLIGSYAMAARRHMHEYGTTSEQLARIAVDTRYHATLDANPKAMYRSPIDVDDVVASKLIADPLHKLDCCAITDGGGAFVMTTAERARDLDVTPVYVCAAEGTSTHWNISQMPDFTEIGAATAGPRALAKAGLTHADIDCLQIYDSFTITVLLALEGLGFCAKGEGGAFVETGALRLGGSLPLNTDGGGLSSCHPGMRGIYLILEGVRQLRGHGGSAQVPGARTAMQCGSGGWLSAIGVSILSTEHPGTP